MATNSAVVVYADSSPVDVLRAYPVLDKPATRALVDQLFPGASVQEIGDELLADALDPPEDVAFVGCFPGLELACCWRLIGERPSQSGARLIGGPSGSLLRRRKNIFLHAVHRDTQWCSYGLWRDGTLVRGLSIGRDPGVLEDVGERLDFERAYWDERRPDPIALGAAALRSFVGLVMDGDRHLDDVDPEIIPVVGYRVKER
jgi:hypothetical protein